MPGTSITCCTNTASTKRVINIHPPPFLHNLSYDFKRSSTVCNSISKYTHGTATKDCTGFQKSHRKF